MKKKLGILIVLTLSLISSRAAIETYSARVQGSTGANAIVNGMTLDVAEGHYYYMLQNPFSWQSKWVNNDKKLFIELGWDESLTQYTTPDYTYNVTFLINAYDLNGNAVVAGMPITKTLQITHGKTTPTDKSKAIFMVDGYHRYSIEITDINDGTNTVSTGTENMYIETRFEIERFYDFNETDQHVITGVGHTPTLDNQLQFHWGYLPGAEEYQLEWTYINNYPAGVTPSSTTRLPANGIPFTDRDFELNNTRITTGFNKYTIPLVYDEGYILYRVRGVGRDMNNPNHVIYGQWSEVSSTRNNVSHYHHYAINSPHDGYKNWQFTATFAEEGKKKEVVSYFDGTLRNRQTVTRINSDNNVIASESIYDHQGRAAIQTLPVPTGGTELRYHPGFNNNTSSGVGVPYSRLDFDVDVASCAPGTGPMNVNSGSSFYYSDKTTLSNNHQDYVPSAQGFPFTQIEYEPDNTGRIKAQSGVGLSHKLGAHDTKYFYGKPAQEELDRLFGYDVGYRKRYKKNMVIDPNGQVSVTYMDPQGRTIATALVGDNPDNLDVVADEFGDDYFPAILTINIDMLNKINPTDKDTPQDDNERYNTGNIGASNDGLAVSSQEINPLAGSNYVLNYSIVPPKFYDDCTPLSSNCYPVVYDWELSMKDQCGVEYVPGGVNPNDPLRLQIGSVDISHANCATPQLIPNTGPYQINNLPLGTYTVSKKLSVNKPALDIYKEQYILDGQANGCIQTLEDFENHYLSLMDTTCGMECDECLEDIINLYSPTPIDYTDPSQYSPAIWQAYFTTYNAQITGDGFNMQTWMNAYYDCTEPCEPISLCTEQYNILLADVSPGGQYARINNVLSVLSNISSLRVHGTTTATSAPWHNPTTSSTNPAINNVFVNPDGTPSIVYVTETFLGSNVWSPATWATPMYDANNFRYVYAHQLSDINDFTNIWQSQWAEGLVRYHPEYCYYERCAGLQTIQSGATVSSEEFDRLWLNQTTYDENIYGDLDHIPTKVPFQKNTSSVLTSLTSNDPYFTVGDGYTNVTGYNYPVSFFSVFNSNLSLQLSPLLSTYVQTKMKDVLLNHTFDVNSLTWLTMWEVARLTVDPCGNWYGNNPCAPTNANSDEIWQQFKYMYISEKQKIQADIADWAAIDHKCYNGCIGESAKGYPFEHGFIYKLLQGIIAGPGTQYHPNEYLCIANNMPAGSFTRRFENLRSLDNSSSTAQAANATQYAHWQHTGQCPQAFNLQLLLNGLAETGDLKNTYALLNTPKFVQSFYEAVSGLNPATNAYVPYSWSPSVAGSQLNVNFTGGPLDPTVQSCVTQNGSLFSLDIQYTANSPFNTNYDWSNYSTSWEIVNFDRLTPTTGNNFMVLAYVNDLINPTATPIEVIMNGTSCVTLGGCDPNANPPGPNAFTSVCPPSDLATAVTYLFNRSMSHGHFRQQLHTVATNEFDYASVQPIDDYLGGALASVSLNDITQNFFEINGGALHVNFTTPLPIGVVNIDNIHPVSDYLLEAQVSVYSGPTPPLVPFGNTTTQTVEFQILQNDVPIIVSNCCDLPNTPVVTGNSLNLVANSDFDMGDVNFGSDLTSFNLNNYTANNTPGFINTNGMAYVVSDQADILTCPVIPNQEPRPGLCPCGDHTTGSDKMMIVKSENIHSTTGDPELLSVWNQGNITVTPNTNYEFIAWVLDYTNPGSTKFSLEINNPFTAPAQGYYNAVDNQGRLFKPTSSYLQSSCGWQEIRVVWNSGNNTTANLEIVKYSGSLETPALASGTSYFALDDIYFGEIEDPCEECTPMTLLPEECYSHYNNYLNTIEANSPFVRTNQDITYYPAYYMSEFEFCSGIYKYATVDYLAYLAGLSALPNINAYDPQDPFHISFAQFASNWYGAHVGDYVTYVSTTQDNPVKTMQEFLDHGLTTQPFECIPTIVPNLPVPPEGPDPCVQYATNIAYNNANTQYNAYIDLIAADFEERYIKFALDEVVETFDMTRDDKEYHYTLYKYDQGNNLVQTIPPRGVHRLDLQTNNLGQQIMAARAAKNRTAAVATNHTYQTNYEYNSLNQLIEQNTPDGGRSRFWYDYLGRLVASQDSEQENFDRYSYTKYDALGRIIEVGQLESTEVPYDIDLGNGLFQLSLVNLNSPDFPYNNSWPSVTAVTEVTRTHYDEGITLTRTFGLPNNPQAVILAPFNNGQQNLRNRVSRTTYQDVVDVSDITDASQYFNLTDYQRATHYSYDIHGNVSELVQENRAAHLQDLNQSVKKIDYTYDLVSGNVIEVGLQDGYPDQLFHRYEYDADNRITNTWVSQDKVTWTQEAKYFYYEHGPLARTEIADDKSQGCDYIYTVQGWLKSNNGNILDPSTEVGKDANITATNLNQAVGKDAYGYGLSYFDNDYQARGLAASDPLNNIASSNPIVANRSLYNGNISQMAVALSDLTESPIGLMANNYTYDQLNRLKTMRSAISQASGAGDWTNALASLAYNVDLAYDPNGNIIELDRRESSGIAMDNLDYWYYTKTGAVFNPQGANPVDATNRLSHVADAVTASLGVDLTNQGLANYTYYADGNLKSDASEGIDNINWTVYNKVKEVEHYVLGTTDIEFEYDASGNRVTKIIKPSGGEKEGHFKYYHYVRDAQGNILAIYEYDKNIDIVGTPPNECANYDEVFALSEHNIYGSSRVAVLKPDVGTLAAKEVVCDNISSVAPYTPILTGPTAEYKFVKGNRNFELSNHLGNVLAVVTDKKIPYNNGGITSYDADVVAQNDYYPFGSVMPGRNSNSGDYRYGFQGQEGDSEIKGVGNSWNYKYRMHDPRLGRFFAVDPLAPDYPWNSPYAFSENRVISAVELEGLEADDLNTTTNTATNSTNTPTDQRNPDIPSLPAPISFNQAQNDPQLLFNTILQTKEVALSTGTPVNLNQVVTGLPNTPTSISGNVNLRDPLPGHNKPLQAQTTFNISSNSIISAGIGDVTATPSAFITLPSFSVGGGGQGAGNQQQGVGVMTSFNLQFQGGGNVNFTFNQNVNSPNVVLNNVAGGVGFFEKIYNTSLNLRDNAVSWGNTSIPPTGGNRLNLTNQLQNQMQQLNNQVNQVRQSMGLPPARIGF